VFFFFVLKAVKQPAFIILKEKPTDELKVNNPAMRYTH